MTNQITKADIDAYELDHKEEIESAWKAWVEYPKSNIDSMDSQMILAFGFILARLLSSVPSGLTKADAARLAEIREAYANYEESDVGFLLRLIDTPKATELKEFEWVEDLSPSWYNPASAILFLNERHVAVIYKRTDYYQCKTIFSEFRIANELESVKEQVESTVRAELQSLFTPKAEPMGEVNFEKEAYNLASTMDMQDIDDALASPEEDNKIVLFLKSFTSRIKAGGGV